MARRVTGERGQSIFRTLETHQHGWDLTSLQHTLASRLVDIKNRHVVAKGEVGAEGMGWEVEVDRCNLLHP